MGGREEKGGGGGGRKGKRDRDRTWNNSPNMFWFYRNFESKSMRALSRPARSVGWIPVTLLIPAT